MLDSLSIDGLSLLPSGDYWFEDIDGLDEPNRRVASADNPGADGGFIAQTLYGMRPVSITGALKRDASPAARTALGTVCQLKRDPSGVRQLKTIVVGLTDGRSFTFQGEVIRFKAPNLGTGPVEFSISIVAEDPLLYDPAEKTTSNIVHSTGGGLIIPFIIPAVAAGSSGGSGTATNEGNSDAPVIMEFVGPLISPYLSNQTVGQFMQLNYAIPAGMTVIVDTSDNTILVLGGGSLIDKKAPGSHFFPLLPGQNDIIFSTGNPSDTGYVRLRWRNASISL